MAVGTGDRACDQVKDGPAFRFQPQPNVTAHAVMHGRVAHHALLADLVPLGLELRFDQGDEAGAGLRKGQRYRQQLGKRDEARVADAQVDRFGDVISGEDARASLFVNDDARENGRWSRRARVCQYVQSTMVAVSYKQILILLK